VSARTFTKFPYRTEFPGSSEQARNSQTLEDALSWARWVLHAVWREDTEYGRKGEHTHPDVETVVITNRNTGYRWILRRRDWRVEFQTPAMVEEAVAEESVDIHLTVEEAEALARAAKSAELKDRRQRALLDQALDQIALVCRQIRDRVLAADEFIDSYARGLPRRPPDEREASEPAAVEIEEKVAVERPRYRPLGDPDNLSLKEAGQILGKARNTVYLWYKQGKFPPAVDVAPFIPGANKPVIVVPRYRLEAWQAGERMPSLLQEVFERRGLHEPPWVCWMARKGASRNDVAFWIDRRGWKAGLSKGGGRIYGDELEEDRPYDVREPALFR
jgi:hypothetical protein